MKRRKNKAIVILGTTASGKTRLAVYLAKKFNGEIISADSRQVYRGMDIGTGKDLREYDRVPYHLIDVVSPKKQYTVEEYQKKASAAMRNIVSRGKIPIICGGSGLYIDALVRGFIFSPVKEGIGAKATRQKLSRLSDRELLSRLKKIDPKTYKIIDKKNRRRVERALEIYYLSGKKKSQQLKKKKPQYDFLFLGVTFPKNVLEKRISRRLGERFHEGMVAEVKKLRKSGVSWKLLDEFGLEYRWVSRFLRGEIDDSVLRSELQKAISHFAKRQMTWFKRNPDIVWVRSKTEAAGRVKEFVL